MFYICFARHWFVPELAILKKERHGVHPETIYAPESNHDCGHVDDKEEEDSGYADGKEEQDTGDDDNGLSVQNWRMSLISWTIRGFQ